MKKKSSYCLLLLITTSLCGKQPFIEDSILSVIYDEQEPIVITKYDVEHGTLMGKKTLYELEIEALICRDARNLKVTIPEDIIEKMVDQVLKQNNLSQDQLKTVLAEGNYTIDDFKNKLTNQQLVNEMLNFRVYSHAIVPYDDVKSFYDNNPEIEETSYQLQTAFIPFSEQDLPEVQRVNLEHNIAQSKKIKWTDPFWVKKSELAESKLFLTTADIHKPIIEEQANGFMVYKVVAKRENELVSFNSRYEKIVNILKEPLVEKLTAAYHEELLKHAIIVHFD